jgi:hypothetical protein
MGSRPSQRAVLLLQPLLYRVHCGSWGVHSLVLRQILVVSEREKECMRLRR